MKMGVGPMRDEHCAPNLTQFTRRKPIQTMDFRFSAAWYVGALMRTRNASSCPSDGREHLANADVVFWPLPGVIESCRARPMALRDLAWNYRIFIIRVDRAQPMISVRNDNSSIG